MNQTKSPRSSRNQGVSAALGQLPHPLDTRPKPANPGGPGRLGTIQTRPVGCAVPPSTDTPEGSGEAPPTADGLALGGVVETALARALVLAAEAKRWDVVQQIAGELEARRLARRGAAGDVIALDAERSRRGR